MRIGKGSRGGDDDGCKGDGEGGEYMEAVVVVKVENIWRRAVKEKRLRICVDCGVQCGLFLPHLL